ncbi:tRNA modification GTPase trmE [Armatimonadetes bacterium GBS]|jgi:tRNA modification GTPase|nr:tRNA modification GTPase trmE [Armatimonadetes bacterium GBS]CUU35748.1 tRNA modification GTPase trmE [Armatimonadetes bacterium GXS]
MSLINSTDTIASIATPPGEGGIGIVRVSGARAFPIAERIFRARHAPPFESHRIYFGALYDPATGEMLDRCLLLPYRAPHSYTGEDVVEFSCHGSPYLLRRVLEVVWREGARPAEPGEFTQRAFLNGKLDLAQAEAVADLIRARTDAQHRAALALHEGRLSKEVHALTESLLGLLATVEAHIDFSEEIGELNPASLIPQVDALIQQLDGLLAQARRGRLIREGVRVAIVGRPNVGKSSLLNALLGEERAIVTPIPGTTRDVIEESFQVKGVLFVVADTAGLRESADVVERLGMERTRKAIQQADLILLVADASAGWSEADERLRQSLPPETPRLLVWNKIDLIDLAQRPTRDGEHQVWISALTGQGMEALLEALLEAVGLTGVGEETLTLTHMRHIESVRTARESLLQARASLEAGMPPDIVAVDLRAAWLALGAITGETVDEALVARIFRDFCIGK